MTEELVLSTSKEKELINITGDVLKVVEHSGVKEGLCLIFVPHATAAILLNEDEPGLKGDIQKQLENWIPQGPWQHNRIDNNAFAHLASALIGQTKAIPIVGGKLLLGTWQEIFLLELDGPRSHRRVILKIIGE